jgi:orotate phosphoribosyltransferase
MNPIQEEVLSLFEKTGALLNGHFILRSGLHSGYFFQCAQVCQDMAAVTRMGELTLEKISGLKFDTVVAPAMGGLVIGQEIARQAGKRYIFLEKQDNTLALRRGFKLRPGEKVLITEDVVTKGGRVQEALDIVRGLGADPVAVTVIVNRSGGTADFGVPFHSLAALTFPTYKEAELPLELAAIPVTKPGS